MKQTKEELKLVQVTKVPTRGELLKKGFELLKENEELKKEMQELVDDKIKHFNVGYYNGKNNFAEKVRRLDLNKNKKLVTANGEVVMLILAREFNKLLKEQEK